MTQFSRAFKITSVFGTLASMLVLSACNMDTATCSSTIQVDARADQCFDFIATNTNGDQVRAVGCGPQTQIAEAGTYAYAVGANDDGIGRSIGSGNVTTTCDTTTTINLDDSKGGPQGDEVETLSCRGPVPAVKTVNESLCLSRKATVFTSTTVFCTSSAGEVPQWGLKCN